MLEAWNPGLVEGDMEGSQMLLYMEIDNYACS